MSKFSKNSIFRAYGTSLLGVFSGLLTSLWLLREITQVIPAGDFGIYAFVLQISAYLGILQLGLDFAASRQIAESLGRNDTDEARSAFDQLRRFNLRIVLFALVAVLALSALLWWRAVFPQSISGDSSRLAARVALVAGLAQVITFMTRPYSAALIGSQYQATLNMVTVARTLCTTGLAFVFLKAGFYVLCVPAAEVVTQLLFGILLRTLTRLKCAWLSAPPPVPACQTKVLGSMLRYGGMTSLGGIAWTLESSMDVLVLGALTDATVVAAFVLWWRFPLMIFDLSSRLTSSAFPTFSHRFGSSQAEARNVFVKVAYLTLGLSTLALVGISFWLKPFVQLWIGTGYTGSPNPYLPMLMGIYVCIRTCGTFLGMFWMASGHAGFTTGLAWVQTLVKLALVVWLVPKLGILGVVIGSCGSSLLQVICMSCFLMRRRILSRHLVCRALTLISFALLVSVCSPDLSNMVGWGSLMNGILATTLVWASVWLVVAYTGEMRVPLLSLLRRLACEIPFKQR